jgi:hypothetical protein
MPRRDFDRVELELNAKEVELVRQLVAELREVAAESNTHFFHTPERNPHNFRKHFLHKRSYDLLNIARETIALRRLLLMPTDACVGRLFESACIESADLDNPHRLGPIRLAARLLSEIEELRESAR